jgi:hypothetical protein
VLFETGSNQRKPVETIGKHLQGMAVALDEVETGGNRSKLVETTYRKFQLNWIPVETS